MLTPPRQIPVNRAQLFPLAWSESPEHRSVGVPDGLLRALAMSPDAWSVSIPTSSPFAASVHLCPSFLLATVRCLLLLPFIPLKLPHGIRREMEGCSI